MTGGAGTAVIRDAGMLWYNPAGLGAVVLNNLQLAGSIFNAKIRRVPGFISADLPNGRISRDAKGDALGSVPGTASIIGKLSPRWSFGLGFFTADSDYIELAADIVAPLAGSEATWHEKAAVYLSKKAYHLGPCIGVAVTPKLRLGLSLLGSYYTQVHDVYVSAAVSGTSADVQSSYLSLAEHLYVGDFNLMLRAGLQWEMKPNWHLGVVVSTPVTTVLTLRDGSILRTGAEGTGGIGADVYEHTFSNKWNWKFKAKEAAALSVAVAYKREGRYWIGLEAEIRPPLQKAPVNLLWNASLGARVYATEKLNWGVGLFTDNSPNPAPTEPMETRLNRYGATGGLELRLPLSFEGKQGPRKFIWAAAASLTYSIEVGKIATLRISPQEENPFSYPATQVVFHQIVLYIGSTLYF